MVSIEATHQGSTRDRILIAADDLFYRQGFEHTSFAHIAQAVEISRGNFYHHFKSKDEILDAVVERRLAFTGELLKQWEVQARDPVGRIHLFIDLLTRNEKLIVRYGCPVGSLCTELGKLEHAALEQAKQLFSLFRTWLRRQFTSAGCRRGADIWAMQLLARTQGAATLASALQDEQFLGREVSAMHAWVDDVCSRFASPCS